MLPPTSWISGTTVNKTDLGMREAILERNKVADWSPRPQPQVSPDERNKWCLTSFGGLTGGASVKLVYRLTNVDYVLLEANVTATGGGRSSCSVAHTNPRSTTKCSVVETTGRPYLGIQLVVSD
jgi:hypothetical protein